MSMPFGIAEKRGLNPGFLLISPATTTIWV